MSPEDRFRKSLEQNLRRLCIIAPGDAEGVPTPYPTLTKERRTDMAEDAYRIHIVGEVKGTTEGGVRYEIIVS